MAEAGGEVDRLRRGARPDSLASLRRLDEALSRTGWVVQGRAVREWVELLSRQPFFGPSVKVWTGERNLEPEWLPEAVGDVCEPVAALVSAGLAAVPALVEALVAVAEEPGGKGRGRVVVHCVEALARIRPTPSCAVPAVLAAVRVVGPKAAASVLFELAGSLRPRATGLAVAVLAERLDPRQEDRVRVTAAQALARLEGELPLSAWDAALAGLRDPLFQVRRSCLAVLTRLPGPDAEVGEALRSSAADPDENLPELIRALRSHDEPLALRLLQAELGREPVSYDAGLRHARCLHLLEEWGHRARSVLPAVRRGGVVEESCVRAVLRDGLRRAAPRPDPSGAADPRAARLLEAPLTDPGAGSGAGPRESLRRRVAELSRDDRLLAVRIALAAVREAAYLADPEPEVREALDRVERWVVADAVAGERTWGDPVADDGSFVGPVQDIQPWASRQRNRMYWAASSLDFLTDPRATADHALAAVDHTCRALADSLAPSFWYTTVDAPWFEAVAVGRMHRAVTGEVLPWLCGTWDPVGDVHR